MVRHAQQQRHYLESHFPSQSLRPVQVLRALNGGRQDVFAVLVFRGVRDLHEEGCPQGAQHNSGDGLQAGLQFLSRFLSRLPLRLASATRGDELQLTIAADEAKSRNS